MRVAAYNTLVPHASRAMRCPRCGHPGLAARRSDDALCCEGCEATFLGLGTVPDLAPEHRHAPGWVRRLAVWSRTARWARSVARPAVDAWTSQRSEDDRAAWVVSWMRPAPGPVLDLCTGAGRTASQIARWMGVARVIGVDPSLPLLRQTQGSTLDPGLAYVRAPEHALPFQDRSVGAVQAMAGLHHAGDPLALVAEAGRVLAPGGTFVGVVHVDEGPLGLRGLARALGEPPVSRAAFTAAIDAAGLEMTALQVAGITAFFAATRRTPDP